MDTYETSIYIAVLISFLVLGCVIVYFVVSVFRQQKRFISLQRKYFGEEVVLLEREKVRISHDLHDGVGPIINVIKGLISRLQPRDDDEALHIKKINEYLLEVTERMGQIAINITPGSLVKKGLAFSLRDFFSDIKEAYEVTVVFKYEVQSEIEPDRSLHLYRIVQELTHNTLKHAQATEVYVHFKERGRKLYLFYSDNGKGFEADASKNRNGLGSGSIRNRCEILHGQMKLFTRKDKGTDYFFEFPLTVN